MAKLQKSTLDPAKISGRCGRLKCCLRYEFETYQDLERELPQAGASVVTARGRGRVVSQEVLSQRVVVELDDRRRIIVASSDILGIQARSRDTTHPARDRETTRRADDSDLE
jgi:cell fate regulator YaaT (PSP1 superfamily)